MVYKQFHSLSLFNHPVHFGSKDRDIQTDIASRRIRCEAMNDVGKFKVNTGHLSPSPPSSPILRQIHNYALP